LIEIQSEKIAMVLSKVDYWKFPLESSHWSTAYVPDLFDQRDNCKVFRGIFRECFCNLILLQVLSL